MPRERAIVLITGIQAAGKSTVLIVRSAHAAGSRSCSPRVGLWLDTSEQTPAETVAEILARAWVEAKTD